VYFYLFYLQSSSTEEDTSEEKISVVFAALDLAVEVKWADFAFREAWKCSMFLQRLNFWDHEVQH
jgi:hypothetical protein